MKRIVCHFSCGAASAVATMLALREAPSGIPVVVMRIVIDNEHPDNDRFHADVERWLGITIHRLRSTEYKDVDDVIEKRRYMAGHHGAPCTMELKRRVSEGFREAGDRDVFGYTTDERPRAERFRIGNPEIDLWTPLIDYGLTKDDCYAVLHRSGIELPIMYQLGYNNNNCIGCVKARGAGYWNKIRVDFPEVFARRAAQERRYGYAMVKVKGVPTFLDELDPTIGNHREEPTLSCGLLCELAISEQS